MSIDQNCVSFLIFVLRIYVRYKDEIPVFLILDMHVPNKKSGICLYISLNW